MNTIPDGGPAFPHDGQQNYTGGATLRDYFAAAALQAMLSNPYISERYAPCITDTAAEAYRYADAMLFVRSARVKE
jgi:hypothetical protein